MADDEVNLRSFIIIFFVLANPAASYGEMSLRIRRSQCARRIQTYYSFLDDSSKLNSVIKIALKHKDFDITNLVLQKNPTVFWSSPSKAYPISGLFVKMLIDKYGGLNKFKEFFVYPDTEKGYEVIYNTSSKKVIDDYYNTLNCYE
jgi:hypothetical protein